VSHEFIGTDAFQEVDIYGMTIPITKHNFLIRTIEELFTVIPEAFNIAKEGRPGPVLIDIPKDIQNQVLELDNFEEKVIEIKRKEELKKSSLEFIAGLINESKMPIIYAGGGIITSNSSHKLYNLAKKNNIPVTLTLMGLGAYPAEDELFLGMLGMHGAPYTNYLMNESDLIIALGVRFDDRATGKIKEFCPNATIIHVDIDESEINKIKTPNVSLVADAYDFLDQILPFINNKERSSWRKRVKSYKEKYRLPIYEEEFHPTNIIKFISENIKEDYIVTTDVGQHQMWVAQIFPFNKPKTLLTSGGLGTMGFGLPAAIGAALSNKDKMVIVFSGDGSILMNIQELATLADHDLNIKVIILNNHHLGLVRQQQELFYKEHYMASKFIKNPDFKIIASGFGINSCDLGIEENPTTKLVEILSSKDPWVINIPINDDEKVLPMVAPGGANINMIGGEKE
ncbi:MAG: thiamine pyrophosphate-dependent enzyme, partial [Clostridium sp.]